MEIIFDLIMQFVLECLIQGLLELLAEYGVRSVGHALGIPKQRNPFLAAMGYAILAAAAAGIGVHFFPVHFIRRPDLRIVNLVVTPVIIGWLMSKRRQFLRTRNKEPVRLDSFAYGYLFALSFALIRFYFAS